MANFVLANQPTENEAVPGRSARIRDLRLDLFRGLANWWIFLGHIPNTVLTWATTRNYGFSDGADMFVFVSGYTVAFLFARILATRGFFITTARLWKRVWQLYVAHTMLFIVYLTSVHYLAHSFDLPHLMDQFNVAHLMERPVETLANGLMLTFKPLNLDVLPLYIVLMAGFPPVLWLMMKNRTAVLLFSLLLYAAARHFGWNIVSYPSGSWYFNPFAWQFLFVLGAWLALGGAQSLASVIRSRIALGIAVTYLVFALLITLSAQVPALQSLFPSTILDAFRENDKTNLAPDRVVHLLALAIVVVNVIPIDWRGLESAVLQPVIKCGQQSLEVFCVGIFLSFFAHFLLDVTVDNLLSQLLIGAGGLIILTVVAYYASWSKNLDARSR